MTALPAKTAFTDASVQQGAFKSALEQMIDYQTGLLGADGVPATARNALAIPRRNRLVGANFSTNPFTEALAVTATVSGTYLADQVRVTFDGAPTVDSQRVAVPLGTTHRGVYCRHGLQITMTDKAAATFVRVGFLVEGVDQLSAANAVASVVMLASSAKTLPTRLVQNFGTGGTPSSDVTTAGDNIEATTSYASHLSGFAVPSVSGKTLGTSDNDFVELQIDLASLSNGDSVTILLAQLEPGTIATEFDRLADQLVELQCQRFARKSYSPGTDPGAVTTAGVLNTISAGTTSGTATIQVEYELPMRKAPTVTVYNPATGATGTMDRNGTAIAAAAATVGRKSFRISSTVTSTDAAFHQAHYLALSRLV